MSLLYLGNMRAGFAFWPLIGLRGHPRLCTPCKFALQVAFLKLFGNKHVPCTTSTPDSNFVQPCSWCFPASSIKKLQWDGIQAQQVFQTAWKSKVGLCLPDKKDTCGPCKWLPILASNLPTEQYMRRERRRLQARHIWEELKPQWMATSYIEKQSSYVFIAGNFNNVDDIFPNLWSTLFPVICWKAPTLNPPCFSAYLSDAWCFNFQFSLEAKRPTQPFIEMWQPPCKKKSVWAAVVSTEIDNSIFANVFVFFVEYFPLRNQDVSVNNGLRSPSVLIWLWKHGKYKNEIQKSSEIYFASNSFFWFFW